MRKVSRALLMGVLLAVLAMLCSCTGMVQDELDRTRAKLEELKALADTVNLNLERLGVIVDHLDDSHTIEPASLQETEGGYKVSFRDGREISSPTARTVRTARPSSLSERVRTRTACTTGHLTVNGCSTRTAT